MAATDYKITTADVQAVHVEAQPTTLRGDATENKKVFDRYSDMIVRHFNNLCDFVGTESDAVVDHDVIIYYRDVLGWVAD